MPHRASGNVRLKGARQHAGYSSQRAFAEALNRAAHSIGLSTAVSLRQVRRWESAAPPWPRSEHQRLLTRLLGQRIEDLGFTPPWEPDAALQVSAATPRSEPVHHAVVPTLRTGRGTGASSGVTPATAAGYAAVTSAHRSLYWLVSPAQLHPVVHAHTALGAHLVEEASEDVIRPLAASLAESLLLAGRLEFFDLDRPDDSDATLMRALQAAGAADDALLGSAILAHSAFIPGWVGKRREAAERMRAARAYARRVVTLPDFSAWLDAVEAECETRCGHPKAALRLIAHAEEMLGQQPPDAPTPAWFDWFSPTRLRGFRGNTELIAGYVSQARDTLARVLDELPVDSVKQRSVVLGDLAQVEVKAADPEAACVLAVQALQELGETWYATGMQRIVQVREALQPWADTEAVRRLDDRLYDWDTTLNALRR